METKSRYEVMSELENKKAELIRERESFADKIKVKEIEIKNFVRALEDRQEDLKFFKETLEDRKETIKELIAGIDASLERFNKLMVEKK